MGFCVISCQVILMVGWGLLFRLFQGFQLVQRSGFGFFFHSQLRFLFLVFYLQFLKCVCFVFKGRRVFEDGVVFYFVFSWGLGFWIRFFRYWYSGWLMDYQIVFFFCKEIRKVYGQEVFGEKDFRGMVVSGFCGQGFLSSFFGLICF